MEALNVIFWLVRAPELVGVKYDTFCEALEKAPPVIMVPSNISWVELPQYPVMLGISEVRFLIMYTKHARFRERPY